MRLYAQHPALRLRQLAADVGLLVWVVGWVLAARAVHGAVLLLAEPGRAVEDLGRSVAGSMGSAAGVAEDVPLVGDELATPFEALARASGSVRGASQSAQDAVDTLATILAVALVVLPVGWLLLRWLPWRARWVREAAAAGQLLSGARPAAAAGRGAVATGSLSSSAAAEPTGAAVAHPDLELLAARAMATAPLPRLAALPPGTGAAWRAGDPTAVRALAGLELERLGLRLPAN
ncbi:hypothetical protein JKP75_19700 [Blastococcus sp. TML/M2B]|uniref:hypothetical protein n=1 Tax=unclassified Blastococcus TaxID=2619396 RepID=UPI00190B7138|nr:MULTISPECIES: hypothetical protein [unclassified Blastococcus]MBN1092623.1 hypothetical protein [Blastococcus sp. TML/M2B]MBN1094566.1 hypothetical protein [Blastococcus sp. TML/M2B]MBN1097269.1 hypothetical protein [Blastococcus sp. TML/C7B]